MDDGPVLSEVRSGPSSGSRDVHSYRLARHFYRLLGRSFLEAKSQGNGAKAYAGIARTVDQFCSESWARQTIFRNEARLVRQFAVETGLRADAKREFVTRSLSGHVWARTFRSMMEEFSQEEFFAICSVKGREHLDAVLSTGRGALILHSHTLFAELFWTWLDHAGIAQGLTLTEWTFGRPSEEQTDPKLRAVEGAKELHMAMGVLRRGGLVHSMGDGKRGGDWLEVRAFNRVKPYYTGFAHLALAAGVPVLSASVFLDPSKKLRIVIEKPFDAVADAGDRRAQIEALVKQYVARHEAIWRRAPANIPWFHMRQHLRFPRPIATPRGDTSPAAR